MSKYTTIESPEQLEQLLSANTYVLVDFWAEWCGPCKAIAPVFDSLASKNTIPNGLAFAKVDVDTQKDVAQKYEITAMPTFILIENSKIKKEIKGANPPALNLLVDYARQEVKRKMKERGEKVAYEEGEEQRVVDLEKMPALSSPFDDLKEKAVMFFALTGILFAGLFYMNNYR